MIKKINLKRGYSVIIEDNSEVAYAYLLSNDEIVGDVWLFNHKISEITEWNNPDEMPFSNKKNFIDLDKHHAISKKIVNLEVKVIEIENNDIIACIYDNDVLISTLKHGSSPGWSALVIKDGPLARQLIDSQLIIPKKL
jgi:hypothetical protein